MSIQQSLPWTKGPLIINAPMGGFAGPDLAIAVSRAGGLGHIGALMDMSVLDSQLNKVASSMSRTASGHLPIGVGLILFGVDMDAALPVLVKHKPAVLWLFAAKQVADYGAAAAKVREACPGTQLWIQLGSVEAALAVAEAAKPDVMCVQGSDAGGHGFEQCAGLTSLFPEVSDALAAHGHGDIGLVAAGGIAEERGAASAFTLGAQGVVLGTRFLVAPETTVPAGHRAGILAASDGARSTVRAKVFDELKGPNPWPVAYDGRALVSESYRDHKDGVGIEEVRRLHAEAVKGENAGHGTEGKGRAAAWSGSGVGLVKREQGAAEIVEEVRAGVVKALQAVKARF